MDVNSHVIALRNLANENQSMADAAFKKMFPKELKRKIKETGTTQAALARHCNKRPQSVTKWLDGKGIGSDTLKLVAGFFDSDFPTLLEHGRFIPVMATYSGNLSKVAVDMAQRFNHLSAEDQTHIDWLMGKLQRGTKKKRPSLRLRRASTRS